MRRSVGQTRRSGISDHRVVLVNYVRRTGEATLIAVHASLNRVAPNSKSNTKACPSGELNKPLNIWEAVTALEPLSHLQSSAVSFCPSFPSQQFPLFSIYNILQLPSNMNQHDLRTPSILNTGAYQI